jgi:serine phosphatase RsbU (regulator of sigma subunit)
MNKSDEQFGMDRVTEHLEKDRAASAPQLIASVRDAATEWTGSEEPVDDQTIVVVRRTEG